MSTVGWVYSGGRTGKKTGTGRVLIWVCDRHNTNPGFPGRIDRAVSRREFGLLLLRYKEPSLEEKQFKSLKVGFLKKSLAY